MAEFYFEYKMEMLSDGLNICEGGLPKLHIERDYLYTEGVNYVMYLTFPQWNPQKGGNQDSPRFTTSKVLFDIRGIGLEMVLKEEERTRGRSNIEVNTTLTYEEYVKRDFRFPVAVNSEDYSGVGKIILKKENMETVIYFSVNFSFKKKLRYAIKGGKIIFEGKGIKDEISLLIMDAQGWCPCLKEDAKMNGVRHIKVNFSASANPSRTLPDALRDRQIYISFDPDDSRDISKYYLLECTGNDTLEIERRDFGRPAIDTYFCPFCHRSIENGVGLQNKYKTGGVGCNGHRIYDGGKPVALLSGRDKNKKAKNAMYCADDFGEETVNGKQTIKKPNANTAFARLLPENFFAHKHFKISVVGSKRAGKTTFISRLFDITGLNANLELSAKMLVNATKKSFKIEPYAINDMDVRNLAVSRNPWYKKSKFYSKYSIDVSKCLYPEATDKMDESQQDASRKIKKYPFVIKANKDSYVYFYDIAGEDAEQSTNLLDDMLLNAPAGLFYLVDGRGNMMGNDRVFQRIRTTLKTSKTPCPIAIILTKFDMVEKEFDENCQCLRSDVYDMMGKTYEGSRLEQNIDLASEEIKSYLRRRGINPDFGANANVKYFGVSSFAAPDAVVHVDQTESSSEVNYLTHMCSGKRMELPVIWMLKQFGCIV